MTDKLLLSDEEISKIVKLPDGSPNIPYQHDRNIASIQLSKVLEWLDSEELREGMAEIIEKTWYKVDHPAVWGEIADQIIALIKGEE